MLKAPQRRLWWSCPQTGHLAEAPNHPPRCSTGVDVGLIHIAAMSIVSPSGDELAWLKAQGSLSPEFIDRLAGLRFDGVLGKASDQAATYERVMKRLGILDADESPEAKEAQDIIATMRSAHASMLDLGLIDWPLEEVPVRCQDAWVNYMAGKVSADFGASSQEVFARGAAAERELIALSSQPSDPRDIPVTDY